MRGGGGRKKQGEIGKMDGGNKGGEDGMKK